MNKNPDSSYSVQDALAPLKAWSTQPPMPFADVSRILREDARAKLGLWSRIELDAALLFKNLTFAGFAIDGLAIFSIVVIMMLGNSSATVPETSMVARRAEGKSITERGDASEHLRTSQSEETSLQSKLEEVDSTEQTSQAPTRDPETAQLKAKTTAASNIEDVASERNIATFGPVHTRSLPQPQREYGSGHAQFERLPNYRLRTSHADASGFMLGAGNHFTAIPAENNVTGRALSEMDLSIGYRFNHYHQLAAEFSVQTFRRFTETSHTIEVIDVSSGKKSFVHTSTFSSVDDLIKVPGVAYTFTAHDLDLFGIEPAVTGFAGITSAGFLWRAGAELQWAPIDHINVIASYKFEKLNSVDYSAAQSQRTLLGVALEYRW